MIFSIESGKLVKLNAKSKLKKAQLKDAELFIKTAYEYTKNTGVICLVLSELWVHEEKAGIKNLLFLQTNTSLIWVFVV